MIVDPDFLDHWKTRLVVDLLGGDEFAPLYILRIWSHCQTRRKADEITITTAGLRALCRCTTVPAEALEAALVEAGFIEREGDSIRVVDWAARNSRLITAWKNGAKGGRGNAKPKPAENAENAETAENGDESEPDANPTGTQDEPNGNRTGTHGEAIRSRSRSRSREEQEQEQNQSQKQARSAPPATDARRLLQAEGVDDQTAADWIAHRKAKRATASATVIEDRKRVCAEAGVSLAAGLALEVSRGWQGLKAEWIANALAPASIRPPQLPYQSAQDKARGWADIATGANNDERTIIDITPTAAAQLG
jgi:hypothetical protein